MRRVVLDVDTGIDDALALLYAVASPGLELCAVTAVVGNVPVEVAARNSAAVLAHAGAPRVPVAAGAARTSAGAGPRAGSTNHGHDGLGGVRVAQVGHREQDVASLLGSVAGQAPFTLVGLAPMTNLAASAPFADDLVVLGGELVQKGAPEFNAGHDPVATARAMATVRPVTLYPIDVFERVSVTPADVELLRASGRPVAALAGELLAVRRAHLVGDAGALLLLTHPHLFQVEPRRLGVVGDRLTATADGRLLDVVVDVDAPAVARAFVEVLLGA